MSGRMIIDSGCSQNVADVVKANVEASNGVAHANDEVLLPLAAQSAAGKRLVELATGVPFLSTLVVAVKVAGLVGALSGDGPFMIPAPTHEAFGKLPAGPLDKLSIPRTRRNSSRC